MGIWRGFKFYTDFGVVFANAPRMHYTDVWLPDDAAQACLVDPSGSGILCAPEDWVTFDINNPNQSRNDILSAALWGAGTAGFGGVDVLAFLPAEYANQNQVRHAVNCFFNPAGCALGDYQWIENMVAANGGSDLVDIINEMRTGGDFDLQFIADDYTQLRQDAADDVNDFLKDLKFVPMIRLGFMYRF
jgi:hypothetical protein